jgi:hypothetical protein
VVVSVTVDAVETVVAVVEEVVIFAQGEKRAGHSKDSGSANGTHIDSGPLLMHGPDVDAGMQPPHASGSAVAFTVPTGTGVVVNPDGRVTTLPSHRSKFAGHTRSASSPSYAVQTSKARLKHGPSPPDTQDPTGQSSTVYVVAEVVETVVVVLVQMANPAGHSNSSARAKGTQIFSSSELDAEHSPNVCLAHPRPQACRESTSGRSVATSSTVAVVVVGALPSHRTVPGGQSLSVLFSYATQRENSAKKQCPVLSSSHTVAGHRAASSKTVPVLVVLLVVPELVVLVDVTVDIVVAETVEAVEEVVVVEFLQISKPTGHSNASAS